MVTQGKTAMMGQREPLTLASRRPVTTQGVDRGEEKVGRILWNLIKILIHDFSDVLNFGKHYENTKDVNM